MSHVFISYSKKNKDYADNLKKDLINRGFDVWMDDEIEPSEDWWTNIRQAIRECAAFVIIMTPEAETSRWVQLELLHGLEFNKPLFPLLRDGDSNLIKSNKWSRIADIQYTDVRAGAMPPDNFYKKMVKRGIPYRNAVAADIASSLSASTSDSTPQPPPTFDLPLLEWCYIPAGKVTIENVVCDVDAFWMAKYPVICGQYEIFMQNGGYADRKYWTTTGWDWKGDAKHPKFWEDPKWHIHDHPVIGVTWFECCAFGHWLSAKKDGWHIALPTEAQWQRAAQGDDGRLYPWGNLFDDDLCNTAESDIGHTTSVRQHEDGRSLFGVVDAIGNIWEWGLSEWQNPFINPKDDPEGEIPRVIRGGSWGVSKKLATNAYRNSRNSSYCDYVIGFRVCAIPAP